ncbi:MAG TPA: Gfo/Idh/MocA family oxidoreductase [Gemmatimonadaceae bacterium]|nr:Gfo/Idh/MocA family oxidoreductase [Gemmatimonadaceae bacterium]
MTHSTSGISAVIVGAGLMGRWHADAARRAGATIVGVVDPDSGRAAALVRHFPRARVSGSLEEFLARGTANAVHICTPAASHTALALIALDAGCHTLVEKPIAEDAAAAERLLVAAANRSLVICPVHQFLFQRGTTMAIRQLEKLGPLRQLEMTMCSAGAEATPALSDAIAFEILPHVLAMSARLCRTPITSGDWVCRRPASGEFLVVGTVGDVGISARISMRGRPPVNQLRLVAEGATIHADLFHGFAIIEHPGSSRAMKIARPFLFAAGLLAAATGNLFRRTLRAEPAYPGLRELVLQFYAAALGQGPNPIPFNETRAVMAVWDRLRHA